MSKSMKVFGGALLCAAMLGGSGCDDPKKDAPTPAATGTAKAAASSAPAASAKADGASKPDDKAREPASAGGSIFKYMPATCEMGRVYVNVAKLLSGDEVQKNLGAFQEKMLASMGGADAAKGQEVVKVLKDGGFEPGRDLREIAVCIGAKSEPPVLVISMSDKVKEPLQLMASAMEKGGKPKPTVAKEGDLTIMTQTGEDGALAEVAPGIILIGKDKEAVTKLAKGGDGADAFGEASKHLVWASINPGEKEPSVDGTLSDVADKYELKVGVQMKGPQAEAMKKDPAKFAKEMEGMAQKVAADLEKGPLKPLAEHIKAAKFAVEGDKLMVTASVPKAAITDTSKAVAEAKPEDLMKAL